MTKKKTAKKTTRKTKTKAKKRVARKKVLRNTTGHDTENKPVETTKRKWNDEYIFVIYDLAKEGLDDKQIAAYLNVRFFTFKKWLKERPPLKLALEKIRKNDTSQIYKHLTSAKQRALLAAFMTCGTITTAARESKISMSNHTTWLSQDDAYVEAYEHAKRFLNEELEREARRRAMQGVRQYKFHNGTPVLIQCSQDDPESMPVDTIINGEEKRVYMKHYYEHKYSDSLLMFMMKGKDPEQWGDKTKIESTNVNTNVEVDLNTVMDQIESKQVMNPNIVEAKAKELIEKHKGSAEG